jgi:hypothetical protein
MRLRGAAGHYHVRTIGILCDLLPIIGTPFCIVLTLMNSMSKKKKNFNEFTIVYGLHSMSILLNGYWLRQYKPKNFEKEIQNKQCSLDPDFVRSKISAIM